MVAELKTLNMEVMVTVWPFSHNGSLSYEKLLSEGWATRSIAHPGQPVYLDDGLHGLLVDPTQKAARDYVWSMVQDGYHRHGIRVFWLDGFTGLSNEGPKRSGATAICICIYGGFTIGFVDGVDDLERWRDMWFGG